MKTDMATGFENSTKDVFAFTRLRDDEVPDMPYHEMCPFTMESFDECSNLARRRRGKVCPFTLEHCFSVISPVI